MNFAKGEEFRLDPDGVDTVGFPVKPILSIAAIIYN
jgi:hypothetical protein